MPGQELDKSCVVDFRGLTFGHTALVGLYKMIECAKNHPGNSHESGMSALNDAEEKDYF